MKRTAILLFIIMQPVIIAFSFNSAGWSGELWEGPPFDNKAFTQFLWIYEGLFLLLSFLIFKIKVKR